MKKVTVLFVTVIIATLFLSACDKARNEEGIVLTTVVLENVGTQFQNGDTYDDNTWYRAFEERFQITVRNLWVSDDYTTQLDMSITDGELPDVFQVNESQFIRLQELGRIMDLTDIFEKYASDTIKEYMAYDNGTFQMAWSDDRLWGIPQLNYGIIDQFQYVWIRKDWKEAIQADDPETMDDVVAIAQEFADVFGGYPITEDSSLECMKRLAPAWGANPGIWLRHSDGTIEYGSVQPEMKEVLKTYAQWYKDGIINPDFPICDQRKMFQDVVEGKSGVCPMAQWMAYDPMPNVIREQGQDAFLEPYLIPSANGQVVRQNISSGNRGYIVVNKDCKHPEAVMELINFYAYMMDESAETESPEFISSLFDYSYTNIPYAFTVINPLTDFNQFQKVKSALAQGKNADVKGLGKDASKYYSCIKWLEERNPDNIGDWLQQGNERSAYGIAEELLEREAYVKNAVWGISVPTVLKQGDLMEGILNEGFTKIILGEEELDYFDILVEQWKDAGGAQATTEANEMYGGR